MVNYKDQFGITRSIEFSLSLCGKYINISQYNDKQSNGSISQMPIEAFIRLTKETKELEDELQRKL